MDRLFVVKKPLNISSNFYLSRIKRKYKEKVAGFSGTLDPFACGCLIVAFGKYPQLFRFLKKSPKTYRATIWLDTISLSFDTENIENIVINPKVLDDSKVRDELQNLVGTLHYLPPKYSAKNIDGKRAYEMARDGIDFEMKQITSQIYDVKFINYNHPFISFDITVSEGSYIRSIAQILLDKLERSGTLSYLERINEGDFKFDNEKALNPLNYLNPPINKYTGSKEWFILGKRLNLEYFETKNDGEYVIVFDDFFSIIEIKDSEPKYLLNRVYFENVMV
ncbi:MAG: tRNA pseudouridine(55) synthase TruB [Epsilonproteobacteria bacterium]|nr:tRNA pseudouridine(55) synthase TruB [Campylobacterota bacterium]